MSAPLAKRLGASALSLAVGASAIALSTEGSRAAVVPKPATSLQARVLPVYQLKLADGRSADVFASGIARIYSKDRKTVETRVLLPAANLMADATKASLPDKETVTRLLLRQNAVARPFKSNLVIVVLRDGVSPANDVTNVPPTTLRALNRVGAGQTTTSSIPHYTNDDSLNRVLTSIGTDRTSRLFSRLSRSLLSSMSSRAQFALGHSVLNIGNAYRLHVINASVLDAVRKLSSLPSVAYASPEWTASTMQSAGIPVAQDALVRARLQDESLRAAARPLVSTTGGALPTNYAVTASAQSMLNAPGVDALAAFAEIGAKFGQLPGAGETITNVSVGDLDDVSAFNNGNDPCYNYVNGYGPTTIVQGGQRYIDWPSMPLIPTYTSDDSGNLSGLGEVCGNDPQLGEVGLDFTVMAPLPHQLQRPGEQGSGLTDMLGIAPGASYRLVVPGASGATFADIQEAMLGAALQQPQTNVISASLGYGFDSEGYPSRYLEDDPLTEALVASIVNTYGIVVTIAAGDGVRTYTNVAIGPNGGSAPTNFISPGSPGTSLSDIFASTVPSLDLDSGSIDVGGTTLDDLFADPPQYASGQQAVAQHAYAETRWTGFTNFSSGDGTRVDLSAPSDNIIAFSHPFGGHANAVEVSLSGGTSAAAPETAAAAAIALQVARLGGRPSTAVKVRKLLASTGSPVFAVPQADSNPAIGTQLNVRRAVEELLDPKGNTAYAPTVARVAIEQRRNAGNLDGAFVSDTDPADISLNDPYYQDRNQISWITIAPDWEWLPANVQFELYVTGHPQEIISRTAWARALPKTILNAAGTPFVSSVKRTVELTYDALQGHRKLATATFSLTFGPASATHFGMLAPKVPPVVTGSTIPVRYDLHDVRGTDNPELVVSQPGRMSPATGVIFRPAYTVALTAQSGTVNVPVSALQGGGIYGVDVLYDSVLMRHSDPAFTRVAPALAAAVQPVAPLLSSNGSTPGHDLEMPYASAFQVSYDVSNVSGATGALLEFSAPGPGAYGNFNSFNNPGGSVCDKNGVDTGSLSCTAVSGTRGTVTLAGETLGLVPALWNVVRVIPTKGGVAAGEAGEVSTIRMDGVLGPNGDEVSGFGINKNGTNGFVTGNGVTASGTYAPLVETFNQGTNQPVRFDYSNISNGLFDLLFSPGNPGLFSGDVGLIADETYGSSVYPTYGVLQNSVALQNVFPMAEPTSMYLWAAAPNSVTGVAAVLGLNGLTPGNDWVVYTSNLLAPTSPTANGPLLDINAALPTQGYPYVYGIAENTTSNVSVVAETDFFAAQCSAPTILNIALQSGKITPWTGIGTGIPYGIAIDSATNRAAVPTTCDAGLTIYDVATKQGTEVLLPSSAALAGGLSMGAYPEIDSKNREFLLAQPLPPDLFVNNNPLSSVLVYNEFGQLLETKKDFNLFLGLDTGAYHDLQITGQGQHAYMLTAAGLVPFDY